MDDGNTAGLAGENKQRKSDSDRRASSDRRNSEEPFEGADRRLSDDRRSYVGRRQEASWRSVAS
jgi:hypothetical protein